MLFENAMAEVEVLITMTIPQCTLDLFKNHYYYLVTICRLLSKFVETDVRRQVPRITEAVAMAI